MSMLLYPVYDISFYVRDPSDITAEKLHVQTGMRVFDLVSMRAVVTVARAHSFGRVPLSAWEARFRHFRSVDNSTGRKGPDVQTSSLEEGFLVRRPLFTKPKNSKGSNSWEANAILEYEFRTGRSIFEVAPDDRFLQDLFTGLETIQSHD